MLLPWDYKVGLIVSISKVLALWLVPECQTFWLTLIEWWTQLPWEMDPASLVKSYDWSKLGPSLKEAGLITLWEPIRRLDIQGPIRVQGLLKLKQLVRLCNKMHRFVRLCHSLSPLTFPHLHAHTLTHPHAHVQPQPHMHTHSHPHSHTYAPTQPHTDYIHLHTLSQMWSSRPAWIVKANVVDWMRRVQVYCDGGDDDVNWDCGCHRDSDSSGNGVDGYHCDGDGRVSNDLCTHM